MISGFSLLFCYITYSHLPARDYLPYAVGKNIEDQMKTCKELNRPCTEQGFVYHLKNDKNQTKKVTDREYLAQKMWEDTTWQIQPNIENIVYQQGYEAPITDFSFTDIDGNSLTADLLNASKVFLLVIYSLEKTEKNELLWKKLQDFSVGLAEKKIPLYVLTGDGAQAMEYFLRQYPLYNAIIGLGDATLLKTMVRANPGLLYLENARVVAKWHHNDFPAFTDFELQSYIAYERKINRWKLENESAQQ